MEGLYIDHLNTLSNMLFNFGETKNVNTLSSMDTGYTRLENSCCFASKVKPEIYLCGNCMW